MIELRQKIFKQYKERKRNEAREQRSEGCFLGSLYLRTPMRTLDGLEFCPRFR